MSNVQASWLLGPQAQEPNAFFSCAPSSTEGGNDRVLSLGLYREMSDSVKTTTTTTKPTATASGKKVSQLTLDYIKSSSVTK